MIWLDTETFSETPIKSGTFIYAEKVEVMLVAYAFDDDPIHVWDVTSGRPIPPELKIRLADPKEIIVAQNSAFDRTVTRYDQKFKSYIAGDVTRWLDTMIIAYAHGLPGSLDKMGEVFNLSDDLAKDKRGKSLIQLFCKPQTGGKRATAQTHPVQWAEFRDIYAPNDISSMRALFKKMPKWNYHGLEWHLKLWHLNQRINDRGMCIDMDLARAAIRATDRQKAILALRAQDMTDGEVESATKRAALIKHILEHYGVDLPDMKAATLKTRIADETLPWAVRELLSIRLEAATASVAKYKALIKSTSSDGRLRGTSQFCGAGRTGRDAGRIFQPLNLPRPTLKQDEIDFGIEALKIDAADVLCGNVMELCVSALRCVIKAPEGKKITAVDLSNIEGRGLSWLAGEEWKLQAFRDFDTFVLDKNGQKIPVKKDFKRKGHDLYVLAYAKAFNRLPEDVDSQMRQIGKVMELALGYQGGVAAFITFALVYGIDLEAMAAGAIDLLPPYVRRDAEGMYAWAIKKKRTMGLSKIVYVVCEAFKRMWRDAHPNIVAFWAEMENAAKAAIATPGKEFPAGRVKFIKSGAWLRMILPSGRCLCYPSPRIEGGKITFMGVSPYSRQWKRLSTYGGKLAENASQAFAADILGNGMPVMEAEGFPIILTVYDEVVAEPDDLPENSAERMAGILATPPEWAPDIPLAAAGFEAYTYRKGD